MASIARTAQGGPARARGPLARVPDAWKEQSREDIERWIDLGMLKPEDRIDPGLVIDHEFVDFALSRLGPYQP